MGDIDNMLIGYAVCCTRYPVDLLSPIGRCGKCGERPEVQPVSQSELMKQPERNGES